MRICAFNRFHPVKVCRDGLLQVRDMVLSPIRGVSRAKLERDYQAFLLQLKTTCSEPVHESKLTLPLRDAGILLGDWRVRASIRHPGPSEILEGWVVLDGDRIRLNIGTDGDEIGPPVFSVHDSHGWHQCVTDHSHAQC